MHWSNHLHLLLYLLQSTQTISALFLYQTGNLTAEASPTLLLTHALNETLQADLDFHCTQESPSIRNVPRRSDCRRIAEFLMPLSANHHMFHRRRGINGDQDIYQLPYQTQFRTCAFEVDLVAGFTTETTSWLTIRATAIGLTQRCLYAGYGLGGWVEMGDHHGISITLLGSLREIVEGNKTTS